MIAIHVNLCNRRTFCSRGSFVSRNVRMRSWRSALQGLFGLREIFFFKGRCAILFMRVIHSSERAGAELALRPARVVWLTGNLFLKEGARFLYTGYLFFRTCGCGAGVPTCKGCLTYGKSFFKGRCSILFMRVIRFSERAGAELALRPARVVWLTGNLFLREGARFFHAGYSFFETCGCGAGAPP